MRVLRGAARHSVRSPIFSCFDMWPPWRADTRFPPVTLPELVQMWTHDEAVVICRRPSDLEDHPDLALRIRGAFGRGLAICGPTVGHRFDPFDRPSAYPAVFGNELPGRARPFAIDADVVGDEVWVVLRLFGDAGFWIDQCGKALLRALEKGVALRANGRNRVGFEILDARIGRVAAALPPKNCSAATVTCLTPVSVRSGRSMIAQPQTILYSTVSRVRGLEPWLGISITADWARLHRTCMGGTVTEDETIAYRQTRNSQRQRDRLIQMDGLLGHCTIVGNLSEMAPLLALADYVHIGSHAALGLGRVRVSLWP